MSELLLNLSVIFTVVVALVWLLLRVHLPGIVGLIIAGIVIGPFGLKLLQDPTQINLLSQLGIILLMFSVGLDFNRERLLELRRASGIGLFQLAFCIVIVFFGAYFLFDMTWQKSLLLGFLVSHTSSTLMLKIHSERGEVSTAPSRLGLGVSITQDLASVPMLVVLPLIAFGGGIQEVSLTSNKVLEGIGTLIITVVVLYKIVPKILFYIVQRRSRELFLFFLMLVCLSTSLATHLIGLSAALGAFIAGLALAGSHFSHQIHAEVSPLRDVLVSLFFISVGMLLDVSSLSEHFLIYAPVLVGVLFIKFFSGFIPVLLWGYPLRVATLTGVALSQIGEFSFVLALVGLSTNLITFVDYQIFIITAVISMLLSPFLIGASEGLFTLLNRLPFPHGLKQGRSWLKESPDDLSNISDHVIIAGYGLNGQNLAAALESLNLPYAVTELDPEVVVSAQLAGKKVYYGDCTRPDMLRRLQVSKARVFVVAISDPEATRRAVQVARNESATLHIIVRTQYVHEIEPLLSIGANKVIPEELEASLEMLDRALHEYQIPRRTVDEAIIAFRGDYLRENSPELLSPALLEGLSLSLEIETVMIKKGDAAIGQTLKELALPSRTGVVILAIRKADEVMTSPSADYKIIENDQVILVGKHRQLLEALDLLEG